MNCNILDSILSSMNGPPPMSTKQIAQNEYEKKAQQMKKDSLTKFRKRVEQLTADFIRKGNKPFIEFQPMDRIYRNIIYDVADVAGLMACSFGEDEVDRHTVIYPKDAGPTEDERHVRNNGGQWNASVAAEMEATRQKKKLEPTPADDTLSTQTSNPKEKNRKKFKPNGTHYGEKYNNLSIEPQKTSTNDAYGEVPSRLKRDHRSIEQTMMDIKAKRHRTAVSSTAHTSSDDHHNTNSDSSI